MTPDKNTVKQLLKLSDGELLSVIRQICADNNVDLSRINIGIKEVAMLRMVLMNASDADIERFLSYLGGGKKNG